MQNRMTWLGFTVATLQVVSLALLIELVLYEQHNAMFPEVIAAACALGAVVAASVYERMFPPDSRGDPPDEPGSDP